MATPDGDENPQRPGRERAGEPRIGVLCPPVGDRAWERHEAVRHVRRHEQFDLVARGCPPDRKISVSSTR